MTEYQPVRLTRTFRVVLFVFGVLLLIGCPLVVCVVLVKAIPFRPMGIFWLVVEMAAGICAVALAFDRRPEISN